SRACSSAIALMRSGSTSMRTATAPAATSSAAMPRVHARIRRQCMLLRRDRPRHVPGRPRGRRGTLWYRRSSHRATRRQSHAASGRPAMTQRNRGADVLAQAIARAGIRRVFTLSGNRIMPIFDAALDAGLELVHVRHEAAAVHMADAHARLTGECAVALVTGGPGHANAASALY